MTFRTLLTIDDLAVRLGRAASTIQKDMRRKPEAVPPRLVLPSTRQLRWRACDVDAWLELHVQEPCLAGAMQ
jgi:predicted DNA-binding transcriptional regulator AlpA